MTWENNWPIILKDDQPIPRILKRPSLPAQPPAKIPLTGSFSWTDHFDRGHLDLRWNFLRVPAQDWYSLNAGHGGLFIAPRSAALNSYDNPSLICCRQQHARFSASTVIRLTSTTASCDAGVVAFQNESHYFFLGVRIDRGVASEVFIEQATGENTKPDIQILASAPLPEQSDRIELKIEAAGRPYSFFYRTGDGQFTPLRQDVDGSILSTGVAGGFQGVMLGMLARTPQ